jgi:hypothetical protein
MNRISLWPIDAWLAVCTIGAVLFLGLRGYEYYFFYRANDLLHSYSWGHVPQQLIPGYNTALITGAGFAAYLMWGAGFFGVMVKARDAAQFMGIAGHSWSAWAIAAIIVPVAGLIVPFLVIGEIRRSIVYSARHASLDETWRTKSGFSVATLFIPISLLVNVAARIWTENGRQATSPQGVAYVLSEMPLHLSVMAVCFAVPLVYVFSTRVFLGALARRDAARRFA